MKLSSIALAILASSSFAMDAPISENMPEEIVDHIFSQCDVESLLQLTLVSQNFHNKVWNLLRPMLFRDQVPTDPHLSKIIKCFLREFPESVWPMIADSDRTYGPFGELDVDDFLPEYLSDFEKCNPVFIRDSWVTVLPLALDRMALFRDYPGKAVAVLETVVEKGSHDDIALEIVKARPELVTIALAWKTILLGSSKDLFSACFECIEDKSELQALVLGHQISEGRIPENISEVLMGLPHIPSELLQTLVKADLMDSALAVALNRHDIVIEETKSAIQLWKILMNPEGKALVAALSKNQSNARAASLCFPDSRGTSIFNSGDVPTALLPVALRACFGQTELGERMRKVFYHPYDSGDCEWELLHVAFMQVANYDLVIELADIMDELWANAGEMNERTLKSKADYIVDMICRRVPLDDYELLAVLLKVFSLPNLPSSVRQIFMTYTTGMRNQTDFRSLIEELAAKGLTEDKDSLKVLCHQAACSNQDKSVSYYIRILLAVKDDKIAYCTNALDALWAHRNGDRGIYTEIFGFPYKKDLKSQELKDLLLAWASSKK